MSLPNTRYNEVELAFTSVFKSIITPFCQRKARQLKLWVHEPPTTWLCHKLAAGEVCAVRSGLSPTLPEVRLAHDAAWIPIAPVRVAGQPGAIRTGRISEKGDRTVNLDFTRSFVGRDSLSHTPDFACVMVYTVPHP